MAEMKSVTRAEIHLLATMTSTAPILPEGLRVRVRDDTILIGTIIIQVVALTEAAAVTVVAPATVITAKEAALALTGITQRTSVVPKAAIWAAAMTVIPVVTPVQAEAAIVPMGMVPLGEATAMTSPSPTTLAEAPPAPTATISGAATVAAP